MTNEIEKKFFDTFGIEAKHKCTKDGNCYFQECSKCDWYIHTYPPITDRILLELICILASSPIRILFEAMFCGIEEVELLKNSILLTCIANKYTIEDQVRTLFEEEIFTK